MPDARARLVNALQTIAVDGEYPVRVEHVPVYRTGVTLAELGITDIESLLKYAEGPSMNSAIREGLVFKAMDCEHQFKAINNKWLEGEK